jgi:hypothetical protein
LRRWDGPVTDALIHREKGPLMRGRLGLVLGVGAASALVLVVSLVSVSVGGPNVTRLAVIEHPTTDTVVDLTTNGDSTGDLLTFHKELFDDANEIALERFENGIDSLQTDFLKRGVYCALSGPTYETPSEVKMYRSLGADAVGMSTTPEVIIARHMCLPCFAVSVITDLGVEGKIEYTTHESVLFEAGEQRCNHLF